MYQSGKISPNLVTLVARNDFNSPKLSVHVSLIFHLFVSVEIGVLYELGVSLKTTTDLYFLIGFATFDASNEISALLSTS